MEEMYEYDVLKEDFLVPVKVATFATYEDAQEYINDKDDESLYVIQRLARFCYR